MKHSGPNPLTAVLLGLPTSLFLGALLSDVAYYRSYQIQWANFAAWLIAGALLLGAIVVLAALIDFLRQRRSGGPGRPGLFLMLVLAMWVVGLFNALVHARDGWATMPAGLILSAVAAVIALVAVWAGVAADRRGEER